MSAYAYPYDPRASYYGPPPAGYPGAPPNGYPHPSAAAPQSPQSPPPARPHTGASYQSPSQYAPPPAQALYYGMPPPQAGGAPPPGGPPPAAPQNAYAPPTPPSTAPGPATATSNATATPQFSGISQEQLQQMMAAFASLKAADSKTSSAPPAESAPAPAPAPAPDSPPVPRLDTSMPPFSHYEVPPSARGPPVPAHYPYPPYGYYGRPGPPSHNGDAPAPPPKHAQAPPPPAPPAPSKTPGPMPGAFGIPEAPAPPPSAPPPPSKTPAPSVGRLENPRKTSAQLSEMSFGSSKSHDRELNNAWEHWGGQLVEVAPGREPRPKAKLVALFRGIAAYMVSSIAFGFEGRRTNQMTDHLVGARWQLCSHAEQAHSVLSYFPSWNRGGEK
jgi:hypothetical protein